MIQGVLDHGGPWLGPSSIREHLPAVREAPHDDPRVTDRRDDAKYLGMSSHRYVTLKAVVDQPGYEWATERLLRRLVYERRIPYAKPANRVLIDLNDLDGLIEESRIEAIAT